MYDFVFIYINVTRTEAIFRIKILYFDKVYSNSLSNYYLVYILTRVTDYKILK